MSDIFPAPIRKLPEADIPVNGLQAYLSQSSSHQIIFMQFEQTVDLPEHAHAAQVGFVLEGRIDLLIAGESHIYLKGDRYLIPAGVFHSAKIYAGSCQYHIF